MSKIFGDDDEESNWFSVKDNFKTDNEYAKKYDVWRKKEELNKIKTKYGEDVLDEEESSSSSDDEEGVELTEEVEKDFFRTLSCLKNKDPSIYNNNVNFFKENPSLEVKKKKKDKPVFLKDYERNLILEKGGVLSDDEESEQRRSLTYNQEQKKIKESFKTVLENSDQENDDNWGGIFEQRKKTKEEIDKEENEYQKWLIGQKSKLEDEKAEKELRPLKEYWNNPNLDKGEKFLRDYILNKKYLDKENDDYIPTYEEILHDSDQDLSNDEENLDKQEEFEHKYNFRYEEPDQEFIKRYPRTMENSLRKTDDKRKLKRHEVKERKKKEKEEKIKDLKKMQELKRMEIEEKLEKLKEITGNESLGFDDKDIDGDFDPEEHDRKMQALFNEEFYAGPENDQKPVFPDLDQELEIENYDRFTGESEVQEPHCEDENFNMDCDYDPQASNNNDEDDDNVRSIRKRRKKSKFANAISKPKPRFDPNDKKFEKYFDEYYKLDCEDIIGDIPCRFKYKKVVPNDFGLTTEEILLASERELNKWCSLKKTVQIRPNEVEKYEQIAYKKKGQNINLKKKILPSLFSETLEENSSINDAEDSKNDINTQRVTNKDKKNNTADVNKSLDNTSKKKVKNNNQNSEIIEEKSLVNRQPINKTDHSADVKNGKRKNSSTDNKSLNKRKKNFHKENDKGDLISDARLSAYGINPKKYKNKLRYKKAEQSI